MNFTDDQSRAWDLLRGDQNVFITGEAGSGKSYLIRNYMQDQASQKFPILASTGAAAVLIGGRTFHSFMGLGIMEGGVSATVDRALQDRRLVKRIRQCEGFVVDEVSMLSGPTLQAADQICRRIRGELLPWGGLRVIAVGDFAQLPPVHTNYGSADYAVVREKPWAFLDPVWRTTNFQTVELKQNMRSGDPEFLAILNDVRRGEVSTRVREFLDSKLNEDVSDFEGTRLFPRRKETDEYNYRELNKLSGEMVTFPTIYFGHERAIVQLKKNSPLPDELHLKENALVMLRQNDPRQRWVNGTTGFVRKIEKHVLTLELLNGRTVSVEPVSFSLLNAEGVALAGVTNFPVTLAYAATIHKAQGMTLDRLMVNLSSLWEPGQAYVALSRVIDPQNLRVQSWQPQSIKADSQVEQFYLQLRNS